ncbi:hypothetical protein ACFO0N_04545 [Halobium salinum]|uniref:AtpZ/AtpI family protein n=1 Tax=Halobium salinum TaxID=1364940 RepID=A0ABD5P8K2_9EURY|nr:hypothetical protein [Halobium salinum]
MSFEPHAVSARASELAVQVAIAAIVVLLPGAAYYGATGDLWGLRVPLLLGVLSVLSFLLSLVAGYAARKEDAAHAEYEPMQSVQSRSSRDDR